MVLNILLPERNKYSIKAGQKVDFDTALFSDKQAEEIKLLLAEKLGVPADKIFKHLKKFVGDSVTKGELLAEKKAFLSDVKIMSELDGLLKEVNHNEGSILIQVEKEESQTVNCFFKGEVSSLEKNTLKLQVGHAKEFDLKEQPATEETRSYGGKMVYLTEEKKDMVIEEEVAGCFVVTESLSSYQQVKLEALDALGFVTAKELDKKSSLPSGQLKEIKDLEKIKDLKLPYCIFTPKESKIYFYS